MIILVNNFRNCCFVTESCLILCDPMDLSPPGSSVHEISQARILERVAISFFKESSQPRDQTTSPALQADSLPTKPGGPPRGSQGDPTKLRKGMCRERRSL